MLRPMRDLHRKLPHESRRLPGLLEGATALPLCRASTAAFFCVFFLMPTQWFLHMQTPPLVLSMCFSLSVSLLLDADDFTSSAEASARIRGERLMKSHRSGSSSLGRATWHPLTPPLVRYTEVVLVRYTEVVPFAEA
jgi:hypothetical protein